MGFGGFELAKAGPLGGNRALSTIGRNGDDVVRTMQAYLEAATRRRNELNYYNSPPLPRDPQWLASTFGPNMPLVGEPLDPSHNRNGQPDPRLWEYPVSWNVTIGKERHVPWEMLKKASETPLFRACIELRKTELATMEWGIRVNPKVATRRAIEQGDKNQDQAAQEIRRHHQDEIDRLESWWQMPDRKNGRNFSEWIALALDEQLTHDGLAIYPHQTYGGDVLGFWLLDGSTIMPLLDETGGRPLPPLAAYQQIMYGFPRGEFTAQTYADADGKLQIPGGYSQGQLVYKRRTPRTTTPYGLSATEQALLDGLLYNRRFGWMVNEYTEGVFPAVWLESDGSLDWNANEIVDYERDVNEHLAGQTAERMRARLLPPGITMHEGQTFGEKYKPDYDLHLIKLVAMHYSITASELGFPEPGGLGSAGFHEGQEDILYRRGRMPDLKWFADLCTELSISYLNMHPDLEFYFLGLEAEDEAAADELQHNRVADGRMTLNEARASLGLAAYHFDEADKAMLETQRGVVFLDGASSLAPPGTLIEPFSENNELNPGGTNVGQPEGSGQNKPTSPTMRRPLSSATAAKDAELRAYRKFEKSGKKRPFKFEVFADQAEAELYDLEKAAAGEGNPKVSVTRNWSLYTEQT